MCPLLIQVRIFQLMLIRTKLGPLVPKVSANLLITMSPGPASEYNSSLIVPSFADSLLGKSRNRKDV